MSNSVNEKSPLYMTIVFTDEVGDPLIPNIVEWRLDDVELGTEIVAWTNIPTPTSTMNFTIPSTNNLIVNSNEVREERAFGIRANEGMPSEAHQEFRYHVINLIGPL